MRSALLAVFFAASASGQFTIANPAAQLRWTLARRLSQSPLNFAIVRANKPSYFQDAAVTDTRSDGASPKTLNEYGTLNLIGFTKDAAVLAADSAVFSDGKLVGSRDKILRIGKFGAVLLSGTTRIGNRAGEINLYEMVSKCAAESRDIEAAETCFHDRATITFQDVFPKGIAFPQDRDSIIKACFAGYVNGRPSLRLLDFLVNRGTRAVSSSAHNVDPRPGFLIGFGKSDFAKASLDGRIPELSQLKELRLYRERVRNGTDALANYATDEMADLEMLLLNQTESPLARRYYPDAAYVGPPNQVVIIDRNSGFKERRPQR